MIRFLLNHEGIRFLTASEPTCPLLYDEGLSGETGLVDSRDQLF
jgi:hypothetical protein